MQHTRPEGYERKFASFLSMIEESKKNGVNSVIVAWPSVLGDNYGEVIESLSCLAEAGLSLHITGRHVAEGGN